MIIESWHDGVLGLTGTWNAKENLEERMRLVMNELNQLLLHSACVPREIRLRAARRREGAD